MQKAPTNIRQATSVTEMARLVRLSRSRFYQLMDLGIFPQPMRHPRTKRPYFDHEQQAQCEAVRASGRGVNGEPVLFATMLRRSKKSEDVVKRPTEQPRPDESPVVDEIVHGLVGLGMPAVSRDSIKAALVESYPNGYADVDAPTLLTTVYRWLRRREAV